jgi:hypothetical protein
MSPTKNKTPSKGFSNKAPGTQSSAATVPSTVASRPGGFFGGTSNTPAPQNTAPPAAASSGSFLFGGQTTSNAVPATSSAKFPPLVLPATAGSSSSGLFGAASSTAVSSDTAESDGEPSPTVNASDATDWKPTTTSAYVKDGIITLLVGTEELEMTVHSSYITVSEFFQTALKKEWAEGQTRTIKLPDEKAELVAQYLDWVYGKGLPTRNTKNDCQKGDVYDVLAELYGLGERLLDSTLRNAIVKEMVRFTKLGGPGAEIQWFPESTAINTIYECTTAISPVRRLLGDLFVIKGKPDWSTTLCT